MARKILLGVRDWVPAASSLVQYKWNPNLPIENLRDSRPQWVAETEANPVEGSVGFDVDLGSSLPIDVFALINMRVTKAAMVRVRCGNEPTFAVTVYDTGLVNAWPKDNYGAFYEDEEFIALGRPRWFVLSAEIFARYIRVEFTDTAFPIQLGNFVAALAHSPSVNFVPGWQMTFVDESAVDRVPFGSSYINRRLTRRRLDLGWQALPFTEMWEGHSGGGHLSWHAAVHGGSQPVVVVPFPDDIGNLSRTAIYGLLRQQNTIRNSMFGKYEFLFEVDQLV